MGEKQPFISQIYTHFNKSICLRCSRNQAMGQRSISENERDLMKKTRKRGEKISPLVNQLLVSNPRFCSSLRRMRLIHAASDSSPSCCCACSMSSRNSGSSRNWNGGLPRLSLLCVDTLITPVVMCLCVITHYTHRKKIATPRSVCSTTEASNQNVK